jgi:hypothetical protein
MGSLFIKKYACYYGLIFSQKITSKAPHVYKKYQGIT